MTNNDNIEEFQQQARDWAYEVFGAEICENQHERSLRFIEEAIELAQAANCPKEDVLKLVDEVYGKTRGNVINEAGDCLLCLSLLCTMHGISLSEASNKVLLRVVNNKEAIRKKALAKKIVGF